MRRLLWTILLFSAYIWVVTSGKDALLFDQGKAIYQKIVSWLEDADVDFRLHSTKSKQLKKRARRWD